MANIQKRPNGKWRARYRDLDGKEHARHFERKLDAQRWLDEVTASMVTGQYVDPRAGRVTFEKYAEKWEGSLIASEAGERITDNALRLHLVPALGARSWRRYAATTSRCSSSTCPTSSAPAACGTSTTSSCA